MLQPVHAFAHALPPLGSRRTRLWALMVTGVVTVLAAQAMAPGWQILPGALGEASSVVLLGVFLAALGCEFIDSSLGMGYGTTLTPLLLLAGFEPLQIIPAILASELVAGITAGLMHQRDGNVDFLRDARARRTALLLAALGGVGTLSAVWLAVSIPQSWLGVFIAVIVLSMGVLILATRHRQLPYRAGNIVAIGAVAAFNKGLSGGGYGPLVTAGQVASGLPAKHSVAITSVAESLTCLIGLAGYLALGQSLEPTLFAPLVLGAILSVPMATSTVRRMPESAMRGLVGGVTLALGLLALLKLAV